MPLLLRSIRSNKRKALITSLDKITKTELSKALDEQVKPLLVKSHNLVVADWKNKPEFQTRKYIKSDSIGMTVFPTGKNAEIYKYIDQGTKPHMIPGSGERIYAKKAKALKFNYGGKYISKTLPNPARNVPGGGIVSGGEPTIVGSVKAHMVSGINPREFSVTIAGDIRPDFIRIIENTFRKISRMLEE
jgi:hypothetical protein